MNKIVCTDCGLYFKPYRVGVLGQEWFQFNSEVYAIWPCDLMQCPGCKKKILSGFAAKPLAYYHDPKFEDILVHAQEMEKKGMLYDIYEKPKKDK